MSSSDKYDRQVRIWGVHGQTKLQNSKVLLLGCDPAGVETLKNLVLPGIGYIVVVDNKTVCEGDIENNFFTPYDTIGLPRAKVVLDLLLEMNSDVKGEWHFNKDFEIDQHYDLVIANECKFLDTRFNLIQIETYGFLGKIRLYSPKCEIVESKPLGQKIDLRIFNPFPELKQYFDSIEIDGEMDFISHIPYIVILHKALQNFNQKYGKYPSTFNEKHKLFKEVILSLGQNYTFDHLENFYEAIENIDQAFESEQWKEVLNVMEIENTKKNNNFYVLLTALKKFVQLNGVPPLARGFPDMKCQTETYVHLKKNIYGKKIESDFEKFKQLCDQQLDDEEIRLFIDNISNIKQITYRTLQQELEKPNEVDNFDNDAHIWYVLFRAINIFLETYQRYPNQTDELQLTEIANQQAQLVNVNKIPDTHIFEICRYEGAKLQMIAAVIGGMASQEAVKLITNQFVPINNTLIFDGLKGEAAIFEF